MSSTEFSSPLSAGALPLGLLRSYQAPCPRRAAFQAASTFGLYLLCVAAMYASLHVALWLTLALALPASGLIVRLFMFQHDCGHGSFFGSKRLNTGFGALCSLVTFTPFSYWRRLHARHHQSWNNLDGRGIPADFFSDCATLAEYQAMSGWGKRLYRLSHHPLLIHVLLPPVIFLLLYRLPFDTPRARQRERRSVYLLDLGLVLVYGGLIMTFGLKAVLLVHLPAIILASIIGIWLFSVQHRFEESQWARQEHWCPTEAALHGASYLRLPAWLQWFSGNIGLHHIHHLRPGIPNYRLQDCHDGCPEVTRDVTILTLREALAAPSFTLWDEAGNRMVPFPA